MALFGYKYKWKCPICKARVSSNTADGLNRVIELHMQQNHYH